jgi:hypothetical protein
VRSFCKPIGFQNRFDAFDKRKNNRGFEHENNFQEVNQQNSSTRFFFLLENVGFCIGEYQQTEVLKLIVKELAGDSFMKIRLFSPPPPPVQAVSFFSF